MPGAESGSLFLNLVEENVISKKNNRKKNIIVVFHTTKNGEKPS